VALRVLKDCFAEARGLLQEEGLVACVRKAPAYLPRVVCRHESWYIWQRDTGNLSVSFVPRVEDYDFKVISEPEELDGLLGEHLSIDSSFSIEDARRMLAGHLVGFLLFVHRELAWWGWAGMDEKTSRYFVNRPPKKVDYTKEAYLGRALTLPRYRGLGLNTYGALKRLEYLKEKGKSGVVLMTLKDNEPAIRTQEKLGFRVCGDIDHFRVLLLWNIWRERWGSATGQTEDGKVEVHLTRHRPGE
jgi:ribosomal protein S18 acetylase RimI-like enzyme